MFKKLLLSFTVLVVFVLSLVSSGPWKHLQSNFFGESVSIVEEPVCGNGILEAKEDNSVVEQCDDGNTDNWDNCSSSCEFKQADEGGGCLDASATNYNPNAVYSNGSCEYRQPEKAWTFLTKTSITLSYGSETIYNGYKNIPLEHVTEAFLKELSWRFYLSLPLLVEKVSIQYKAIQKQIYELDNSSEVKNYQESLLVQENKKKNIIATKLDLLACTKNRNYRNKNYAYTSIDALDARTQELSKILAKTGTESLRVKLATLQTELKKIPTRNTAERKSKNAEITQTTTAIKSAEAEYAALINATNIKRCIQPARIEMAAVEKEISRITSQPGYIKYQQDKVTLAKKMEESVLQAASVAQEAWEIEKNYWGILTKPIFDTGATWNNNNENNQNDGNSEDAVCGNGVIDPGEFCDDGNQDDNDYCTNACSLWQKIEQYCGDDTALPCQDEMNDLRETNARCKEMLAACSKNPSDESICQESKIACQEDEKSEQNLRQCVRGEIRCLDKFYEHVRPDLQDGWEGVKDSLGL